MPMVWPSLWPLAALVATVALALAIRRFPPRSGRRRLLARAALVGLLAVASGSAALELWRAVTVLRTAPLVAVLLDLTPVRTRIETAVAALLRDADLDALIADALAQDDPERARALARAAEHHGKSLSGPTRDALAAADAPLGRGLFQARDLGRALSGGAVRTTAGLATAVAVELSPIADLRDIGRETGRILSGEEPDRLILALSAAGLAATTATLLQPAAAGTAMAGKAVLKAALRGGRIGAPLAADLRRTLARAVDLDGIVADAPRLAGEPRLATRFVRAEALAPLQRAAGELGTLATTSGPRAALLAATSANTLDELPALARISRTLGAQGDDALRILGRTAAPALRLGRTGWLLGLHLAGLAAAVLGGVAALATGALRRMAVARIRRDLAAVS